MTSEYIYKGYEIREDVIGWDVFIGWDYYGTFDTYDECKRFIDERGEEDE